MMKKQRTGFGAGDRGDQVSGISGRRRETMMIETYRDLKVWQKAMDLVVEIYQITKKFPKEELFPLTSQIQRAVTSVPTNIAEGHGRLHRPEYIRFLSIAMGSLMETETHLHIAIRLGYINQNKAKKIWVYAREQGAC
jgi:four helix bundle protein